MKRKVWFMCMAFLLSGSFLPAMSNAQNRSDFTLNVNGQTVATNSFVQNGRMMVRAAFFKQAGVEVNWSESNQSVLIKKDTTQIALTSGAHYADSGSVGNGPWKRDNLDTTTTDRKDGTYIPLRYTAEKLGLSIYCDAETRTVYIKTNGEAAASNDISWLYKITEAEAGGEGHQGKVAVAATILNRVKSPEWPNTIKGVIFQVTHDNGFDYYQFSPVQDKRIFNVTPSKDTIKAVNEALGGLDPTNGALVFYNPNKTDNQWVRNHPVITTIGNHVFAK